MKLGPRATLGLILLGHAALSLLFNFVTPVFEGPDEPNHYLFIRYLQLDHSLPVQGTVRDAVRAHHPPGYFALGALLTAMAPPAATVTADFSSLGLQINPRYWFRFDDPDPYNKSVFLHFGPGEVWPYHGLALTVHVGRLLSLAFTLLAIGLTFVAARQLRPDDTHFAGLAAGLIAFNPMVLFMSGVIQNDASALAAGVAVLAALGWLLRRGASPLRWLAVGVAYALGVLLKAGLLTMAAPIGLVALFAAWQASPAWAGKVRSLALTGLALSGPVAALDGWWFVRNQILYGDWTANASIVALWGPLSPAAQRQFLPLALYTLATGMLGRFGNGGIIDFSRAAYLAAGLLMLAALAGSVRLAIRAFATVAGGADLPDQDAPPGRLNSIAARAGEEATPASGATPHRFDTAVLWAAHVLTIPAVTVSVVLFALEFNGGATGKYLFPMFPSLAIVAAAGWLAWFPPRWRGWGATGLPALSAAASFYAVFGLLLPAFGPPRQPLPGEMNGATPLEADLGGDARLLAYRLDQHTLRPGQTLRVTVYWLPEASTSRPHTVFVHLFDPALGVLAQRDIYPGAGTYPTTVWQAGRPFVDTYALSLPADAPATTQAQLVIGLYDEATGQRLTATGGDAGPPGTDWIQLGHVNIVP